jgi:hypothetical protein
MSALGVVLQARRQLIRGPHLTPTCIDAAMIATDHLVGAADRDPRRRGVCEPVERTIEAS